MTDFMYYIGTILGAMQILWPIYCMKRHKCRSFTDLKDEEYPENEAAYDDLSSKL